MGFYGCGLVLLFCCVQFVWLGFAGDLVLLVVLWVVFNVVILGCFYCLFGGVV